MSRAQDEQNKNANPLSAAETWTTYHKLAQDDTKVNENAQTASLPFGVGTSKLYATGDIVDNSYKLLELIGQGSMGVVFHCRHLILGKDYALKLLATNKMSDESWSRFQSEAKALARLHHPGVVGIHNMGIDDKSCPYYVMDLLTGESLHQLVKRKKRLSMVDALDIFIQLADALNAAHQQGIIHRDIKPSNVMVLEQGGKYIVKLVDFGIARLSNRGLGSQNQTAAGTVFGTPFYMSPEQSLGTKVDERSDIYSLGCTLFEALTGNPPLCGANAIETILMHQTADMPSLNAVYPDGNFSNSIEMALSKMLARDVRDRYQTMQQVGHDLARIQAGKSIGVGNVVARNGSQTRSEPGKDKGGQRSTRGRSAAVDDDDNIDNEEDLDEFERRFQAKQRQRATVADTSAKAVNIFSPLVISLLAIAILIFSTAATAYYMSAHSDKKSSESSAPSTKKASELGDPFNEIIEIHLAKYKSFCTQTTNKEGDPVRRFVFPQGHCHFGFLRAGDGPYKVAEGTVDMPFDKKIYLYLQCLCTPFPQLCDKFGDDNIQGLEIVTFKVPEVIPRLKKWRTLEHLSFYNSIEHVKGLDGSEIAPGDLQLIDQMTNLQFLGLNGSLGSGKQLNKKEILGQDIAQMKILSTIHGLGVQEVNEVQPLLEAVPSYPNIKELHLIGLKINDSDIERLSRDKNLEVIRIIKCPQITPACAASLRKLPRLKTFVCDNHWTEAEKETFRINVKAYVYEDYRATTHN